MEEKLGSFEIQKLLPPHPLGWYAVAFSDELTPGEVKSLVFMGQDVVLYRTQAGQACLAGAYCPHLGAHLGFGGQVCGELIRCPFHGFEYDSGGACQSTPYHARIPPRAKLKVFPLQEVNGLILAYYDPEGKPPAWVIPPLDQAGWGPLLRRAWTFRGHPQETTENSVDMGHFSIIHGYSNVRLIKELVTDGPYLTAAYGMTRQRAILGQAVDTEFEIHARGLGYSQVDIHVPRIGLRARLFVLATPQDGANIILRIAVSGSGHLFDAGGILPLLRLLPRRPVIDAAIRATFEGACSDVSQDFVIWQHKRYIQPPILAEGDGPVGRYRLWARQFYRGADLERI